MIKRPDSNDLLHLTSMTNINTAIDLVNECYLVISLLNVDLVNINYEILLVKLSYRLIDSDVGYSIIANKSRLIVRSKTS